MLADKKAWKLKAIFDEIVRSDDSGDTVSNIVSIMDLIDQHFGKMWPTIAKNNQFRTRYGELVQDCKFKKQAV